MTTVTSGSARPPVAWPVLRAVVYIGVIAAIWAIKPGVTAVLCTAVVMAGWAVAVLGRELERFLAIALLPMALAAGALAAGWVFAVQPAIDRAEAQVADMKGQVSNLAGALSSIPSAGSAAARLADQVKRAADAASHRVP